MGDGTAKDPGSSHRDLTDESLRVERDRADAEVVKKTALAEQASDDLVHLARDRRDELMRQGRHAADQERIGQPGPSARVERERSRADDLMERERSSVDSALEQERAERKRFLTEFLAVERQDTDEDLLDERAHADTAIAARDQFLATVSHDLRTLLGALSLNATMMSAHAPNGIPGDPIRKHAATSQRLVVQMSRLINDLLDIASIDAGKLAIFAESIVIADIVGDTLDAFGPIAAAKGITLVAEAAGAPPRAKLDAGRILQVLANTVSNAVKFTPKGGRVTLRVHADRDELRFAVTDTGVGIPADALTQIFERFRQVSTDRRGLGLGLYISKCIVEAHGGRMWAESEPPNGATIHVAMPITP